MAIALYQSAQYEAANELRPHTLAFASNNLAGSLLTLTASIYNGGGDPAFTTPTDSRNTYTAGVANQSSGARANHQTWYTENCGAGANTTSYSATGGIDGIDFVFTVIAEFTGVATSSSVDNTSSAGPTNDAAPNTGTASLSTSGCMIYSAVQPYDAPTVTETDTNIQRCTGITGFRSEVQYRLGASSGNNNATWSLSGSDPWVCHFIAFKAAAGGGFAQPVPSPIMVNQAINRAATF